MPSCGAFSRTVRARFFMPVPTEPTASSALWPRLEAVSLTVWAADDAISLVLSATAPAVSLALSARDDAVSWTFAMVSLAAWPKPLCVLWPVFGVAIDQTPSCGGYVHSPGTGRPNHWAASTGARLQMPDPLLTDAERICNILAKGRGGGPALGCGS